MIQFDTIFYIRYFNCIYYILNYLGSLDDDDDDDDDDDILGQYY